MSHYARLKVTQDAPVEVIRAAYRVLAAKFHPDRQTSTDESEVAAAHAEMVALNAAYQVLNNPQARREYDALLGKKQSLSRKGKASSAAEPVSPAPQHAAPDPHQGARVDMDWMPPKSVPEPSAWPLSRKVMFIGGSFAGLVMAVAAYSFWQMLVQHQMDKALSDQYAASPPPVAQEDANATTLPLRVMPAPAAGPASAAAPVEAAEPLPGMPKLSDLSRMSNEELVRVVPDLHRPPAANLGAADH